MNVTIQIPSPLRDCCDGDSEIRVRAVSVQQALDEIETHFPELYRSVCDETGAVRRHVNVFVNSSLVRGEESFRAALEEGDVITIFQAVSGG